MDIDRNLKKKKFLQLLINQVQKDLEVDFHLEADSEQLLDSHKCNFLHLQFVMHIEL